jgi:2-polyprenyl-3-methyl-5-hydroxy-6-metoxy-1,4-benzoquinol methylase
MVSRCKMRTVTKQVRRLDGIELDSQEGTGQKLAIKRAIIKQNIRYGRILDLGCGNGLVSKDMGNVTGVDISPARLAQASRNGLKTLKADVLDTKLPAGHFDVVIATDIIEHMQRPYDLLIECNRLLREGGQLFLETPNAINLERFLRLLFYRESREESPNHLFLFDTISLTEMLTRTDFEIDKINYVGLNFPGWRKLIKIFNKKKEAENGSEELRISTINKLWWLCGRIFKPFAYSLIIVAHKQKGIGDAVIKDPSKGD